MKKTWVRECHALLRVVSNTGRKEQPLPNWLTPQICSFTFSVETALAEEIWRQTRNIHRVMPMHSLFMIYLVHGRMKRKALEN